MTQDKAESAIQPAVASRRRRFHFSLRTLLVLVLVFALPLGWIAKERRQSQREHELAESLTDDFKVSFYFGPYDSMALREQGKPQGFWRDLARNVLGERVPWISTVRPDVECIGPLQELTSLQLILLSGTPVSDLRPIADLRSIRWLYLDHTQVSDLSPLVSFKQLTFLDLSNTPVTDLGSLSGLTKLKLLRIDRTNVTDLAPLAKLANLEVLNLHHTNIGDLTPLYSLNKLKELELTGVPVSSEQIDAFRSALPSCRVFSSQMDSR